MESFTITVHWHDENQPVYSVDFQPVSARERSPRLATGGGDNNVRLWSLVYETTPISASSSAIPTSIPTSSSTSNTPSKNTISTSNTPKISSSTSTPKISSFTSNTPNASGRQPPVKVEYLTTLRKHTQAVNVVRFDPRGEVLATAGDDGSLILWALSEEIRKDFGSEDIDDDIKESWFAKSIFRSSTSEIYDISWSPDSKYIATGSMDNITRIYNVLTGEEVTRLAEHNHYVQGVAWDPKNEFIATQSADRSVHVYSLQNPPPTTPASSKDLQLLPTSFFKISRADLPTTKLSLLDSSPSPSWSDVSASRSRSASETSISSTSVQNTPSIDEITVSKPATPMNPPANNYVHQVQNSSPPSHKRKLSNETLPAVKPMTQSPEVKKLKRNTFLYHSETLQSFFRRLAFSPDGSLLLTPSGIYRNGSGNFSTSIPQAPDRTSNDSETLPNNETNEADDLTNTVYIYIRSGFNKAPVAHLPGLKKPAIAISFSPIIYHLTSESAIFKLPYKMVFAVATQDSIVVYDTQRLQPLGSVSNLHYSTITDLCWNKDGESIIISSADGFCSLINFKKGTFGKEYETPAGAEDSKKHEHSPPSTDSAPQTSTDKSSAEPSTTSVTSEVKPTTEVKRVTNDISGLVKRKKPKTQDQNSTTSDKSAEPVKAEGQPLNN